jgi:hypothetical protein
LKSKRRPKKNRRPLAGRCNFSGEVPLEVVGKLHAISQGWCLILHHHAKAAIAVELVVEVFFIGQVQL